MVPYLKGEFDEAFDFYAKALDLREFFPIYRARFNYAYRQVFPGFFCCGLS